MQILPISFLNSRELPLLVKSKYVWRNLIRTETAQTVLTVSSPWKLMLVTMVLNSTSGHAINTSTFGWCVPLAQLVLQVTLTTRVQWTDSSIRLMASSFSAHTLAVSEQELRLLLAL